MLNRTLSPLLSLSLSCVYVSFLSQHSRLAPAYPFPLFLRILYDDDCEDDCNTHSSYFGSIATSGLRSPTVDTHLPGERQPVDTAL